MTAGDDHKRLALPPVYVAARRILLDALVALEAHREAVIVAGAQAIYLRTGEADFGIAPFTTDADLALNPKQLGGDPTLPQAMIAAGFSLRVKADGHVDPGTWEASTRVADKSFTIPVDLIVPEAVAPPGGRRGARLGVHGREAAKRAVGLEAALIDQSPMQIAALEPSDARTVEAKVAGPAALMIAKAHKIHDRIGNSRRDRTEDKDAADVFRLMQTTNPAEIRGVFALLLESSPAQSATADAMKHLDALFGRRGRPGIAMATRSLTAAVPEARISAICVAYIDELLR